MASAQMNDLLDQAAGKAQKSQGASLHTFLASISTAGGLTVLASVGYVLLRKRFPELYERRAGQSGQRKWQSVLRSLCTFSSPLLSPDLVQGQGYEAYLLDRYLFTIARIFLFLSVVVAPVLIPLNVIDGTNSGGGVRGLDRLSFANVGPAHTGRYWCHFGLAVFAAACVSYTLQSELRQYSKIQRSPAFFEWNSCILLRSLSQKDLGLESIQKHFHKLGGGIRMVRHNHDYSNLRTKVRHRDALIQRLEAAVTDLVKQVSLRERGVPHSVTSPLPRGVQCRCSQDSPGKCRRLRSWLPGLWAPKIDSVHRDAKELVGCNAQIARLQSQPEQFPRTNSAFVYFNTRLSPSLAALALRARLPPSWTIERGTAPQDIVWSNLSVAWWQHGTRSIMIYMLIAVLILGFGIPVMLVGTLSQIEYLPNKSASFEWVRRLPTWLLAVVQGVLPPALLALLMSTVPMLLRFLSNMQGHYSRQITERNVQIYYFTFLFVQVFLVVSLSASLTTLAGREGTIQAVPTILAENLPKASNYFLSYIVVYTFTTIASSLLQLNKLVHLLILSPIFDKTARQKWVRIGAVELQEQGTFIPPLTNLACIGLVYAVIAPLILPISLCCFGVLWVFYRWQVPTFSKDDRSTTGLFYPTALRQLLTGIYFMELSIAGLFLLVRDSRGRAACQVQGILMIMAVSLTGLYQYLCLQDNGLMRGFWKHLPGLTTIPGSNRSRRNHFTRRQAQGETLHHDDDILTVEEPIIWIPSTESALTDDEVDNIDCALRNLRVSRDHAKLDRNGRIHILSHTPDSSH